MIDDDKVKQ